MYVLRLRGELYAHEASFFAQCLLADQIKLSYIIFDVFILIWYFFTDFLKCICLQIFSKMI